MSAPVVFILSRSASLLIRLWHDEKGLSLVSEEWKEAPIFPRCKLLKKHPLVLEVLFKRLEHPPVPGSWEERGHQEAYVCIMKSTLFQLSQSPDSHIQQLPPALK